ncbi:MAG TPA: hypothetical protein PLA50_14890 [Bacteroidia bacterium]|nr:hypothetical protein [Bacteroidia bacterium]
MSYRLDTRSFVWTLALVALGACYRVAAPVFEFPVNTAPLMALSFGGAMLLGWRFWWVPVAALLASDLALGWLLPGSGIGGYTLMSALLYAGSAWLGGFVGSKKTSWPALWFGTLGCGVLFYLAANTYAWLLTPDYAKTLAGWWQSQTTGLPQFSPPAWFFLRNSLIADTLWCGIAALVHLAVRRPVGCFAPVKGA